MNPCGDDLWEFYAVYGGIVIHGSASANESAADDTDEEREQVLARKRPCGFTAEWADQ